MILYVTIRELLQLMVALATPIADLFPIDTFDHQKETEIIAALLAAGAAEQRRWITRAMLRDRRQGL